MNLVERLTRPPTDAAGVGHRRDSFRGPSDLPAPPLPSVGPLRGVRLPRGRYPLELEAAAWYAHAEAVTNAIRHGRATRVQIDGRQDQTG